MSAQLTGDGPYQVRLVPLKEHEDRAGLPSSARFLGQHSFEPLEIEEQWPWSRLISKAAREAS